MLSLTCGSASYLCTDAAVCGIEMLNELTPRITTVERIGN